MTNGVCIERKARVSKRTLGVTLFVLAAVTGCDNKAPSEKKDEPTAVDKAVRDDGAKAEPDTRATEQRRGDRDSRDRIEDKGKRRSRDRAQSRKWAKQHRYMGLAIEHLDLREEQLTQLADMNWKHFIAIEKSKSERPSMNDALLKMMETGVVDQEAFKKDDAWLAANAAMQEAQYKERMTTLHKVLDKAQRTQLAGLLEAEQKKQVAAKDKSPATAKTPQRPPGCGARGYSILSPFVTEGDLTRTQKKALADLCIALEKDSPTDDRMADLRQARRIFDMGERKSFVRSSFDVSKLVRPTLSSTESEKVSACRKDGFKAFFGILTEADRQAAVARFKKRTTRRQGGDGSTPIVDAGLR